MNKSLILVCAIIGGILLAAGLTPKEKKADDATPEPKKPEEKKTTDAENLDAPKPEPVAAA